MPSRLSRLHYILHELRRRHVFRVVGAYVFCVWVILQVGAIVFPPLLVPAWVLTVLVVLSIVGLPLVAVLTWMYDITPRGVVRTSPLPHHEPALVKVNWHYVDLVIIAALLSVLAFVLMRSDPVRVDHPVRSIAVLPFADLSIDQDNQYFSDGLAEVLIDSLGRIGDLRVMSRTSSFTFREQGGDLPTLAARFDVDAVLEGSVRKSGNRVRVNTRLVHARHGHNLWSETYDATLDDIFQVQDNIARSVAEVLEVELLGDVPVVGMVTTSDDAFDHYLRGRAQLRGDGTLGAVQEAIEHFEETLRLDRRFALARAGLCTAHWQRYEITRMADAAATALDICNEAGIHDDQRAETHIAIGNILTGTGQYERAEAAFNRALEIEPKRSEAHLGLGRLLALTGDDEQAEALHRRAIELDPAYWRNYSFLSAFLSSRGRMDEAIAEINRAIRLEPDSPRLYSNLGGFLLITGDHERAAQAFEESIRREPTGPAYSNAGIAHYFSGDFAAAESMYREAIAITPEDYRLHANLADAIALQEHREEEALEHYQEAVRLSRQRLDINPLDLECRAVLALNLIRSGQPEKARTELEVLVDQDRLGREIRWQVGEALYLLEEMEPALNQFRQAIDKGHKPQLVDHNPALASLYSNPRFLALLEEEVNPF
jgi:adenylate cyclase